LSKTKLFKKMVKNPPDILPKTLKFVRLRIAKLFSFRKKIKIGSLTRKVINVGLFLGIHLVIISAIYYYFFIFISSKAILLRSFKNIKKIGSAKYSAEINLDFTNTTNFSTAKENSAESNILKINEPSSYKILGDGVLKSVGGNLESDSNFQISLNGNEIAKVYLKNSPDAVFLNLAEFSYTDLIDKTLINNWIKIDSQFLNEKLGIKDLINLNQENQTGGKITDRLLSFPPFELGDKYPSDKVRGIDTYHFKFLINKNNLEKVLNLSESSFIAKMEFGEGNLWIGKRTNSVLRLKGSANINNVGSEGTVLNLTYDLTFYDFNNTPAINVPDNFLDIRKLLD
jgi:hypothetical protein